MNRLFIFFSCLGIIGLEKHEPNSLLSFLLIFRYINEWIWLILIVFKYSKIDPNMIVLIDINKLLSSNTNWSR